MGAKCKHCQTQKRAEYMNIPVDNEYDDENDDNDKHYKQ